MKSILAAVVLLFLILAEKAHGAGAVVPYQQLYPSDFQTNLFPLVKLNLDPTQFNTNLTEIHISETSIIGRQYWTNLGGNLFPVGFPFNTNRFLIKASTGFTGTGTNYFGDDGVFHPLNVTIGTNDLWASVGNVYFPAQQEDSLIATNINSALSLVALGAFTMPASLSSNLVAGENDLNAYQNGTLFLLGPTADPNDTTISLNAGSGTGQIIFIQNAQNNKGFSLTNNTPQWDASGTILLTMGDWKPTTAGQTLMLMQSQLGNWQEVGRFGGGVPSDGFWQYGVAAAGVLSPSIGSQVWATNLTGWNKLQAAGSFTTPAIHVYSVVGGSNQISMAQTSLINVNSQTNANAVVYLTAGDGDVGQHVWMFNTFTNTGFCLNTGVAVDNTNLIVLIRGNAWCPTEYGESLELVREPGGWVEIGRSNPHGVSPDNLWEIVSDQLQPSDHRFSFQIHTNATALLRNQISSGTVTAHADTTYGAFLTSMPLVQLGNGSQTLYLDGTDLIVSSGVNLGKQNTPFLNSWMQGTNYILGTNDVNTANYSRLALNHSGLGGAIISLSEAAGAGGSPVPFDWYFNATRAFRIAANAVWPNDATKYFDGSGHWSTPAGGGGATINPTDAYVPVRANSTTFNDSYLAKSAANEMYFTNSALKVDNDLTVNPRLQDPNTHGVVIHGDSSSHGTTIRDDHVVTGNNQQNRIGTSDGYNTYGFSADGTATATALNPQQFSENVDWIGTAYSTNAGVLRSVGMGSQLHTFGAANEPTGLLTFVSHINGVAVTNMTLSTGSAWDGSGTHFLSDDGTFKTASGGASYWQTNSGSGSISPLNTGTGFYITDTGQIGAGFPTNIFHGKDIGLFRQVDTSPLGATPMFVNTGIADTWPSPTYYGEWWTKLETNTATQVLVSSGPGGTFEHAWTASHTDPSTFFYYQTLSNNIPTFELDGQSGDLSIIKSVPYSWPTENLNGVLANDGSGNLSWGIWQTAILTDSEGGPTYVTSSTNVLASGIVEFAVNNLTNFWGSTAGSVSIGFGNGSASDASSNNVFVFSFGSSAGLGQTNVASYYVFNIGESAGYQQFTTNANRIFNYGAGGGELQRLIDSSYIFNYGDVAGYQQVLNNSSEIYNYGQGAGSSQLLTNSSDVYNFGLNAGTGMSGSLTHVFNIGSGAVSTNSNSFVFGDSAYNYFFPGASMQIDNGAKAGSLTAVKSIRQYQGTLTHAGTMTLDFDGATTVNSMTVTGALTLATSNLATNRNYRLKMTGTSTNSALTAPGWKWQGFVPTTITANKQSEIYVECWGATDATALAWFSEEP